MASTSVDRISGAELRSLLRTAERSGNWLAKQFDVSRTTVNRWKATGVPEAHSQRVRDLLPPSAGRRA